MKKLLSLICSLSLSAALLAGCSSTPQEPTVSQTPSDSETPTTSQSVTTEAVDVKVMALKGPTAMGMVQFMSETDNGSITDNNYDFTITAMTDEVSAALSQGTTDIAAVPANLASVLYNNTEGGVQVLAINTLGVLYIVESGDTVQSMEDLRGKTIYASGKGGTPEYALNYVLAQNGIDPTSDVTIEWKSEQAECLAALTAQENSIAMLPQPFVTTAQSKSDRIRVALDLTEEWDKLQADSETPSTLVTGVVVARRLLWKNIPRPSPASWITMPLPWSLSTPMSRMPHSWSVPMTSSPRRLPRKPIPACNIVFMEGPAMKDRLSSYLTVLFDQNAKSVGGTLPADDFYYSR